MTGRANRLRVVDRPLPFRCWLIFSCNLRIFAVPSS